MKFILDSSNAVSGSSLHLKLSGFSIELSDVSGCGKVAVAEDSGKISIEVLSEIKSVSVKESLIPAVEHNQPSEKDLLPENMHVEKPEKSLNEPVSDVQDIPTNELFKKLAALRLQIANEANLPPYIIFHDTTLKDMASKMPVDLDEMKEVSGVGQSKLQKYGVRFVNVIKEHLADSA
jgi:superfamily II DNA helicase RecQ